MNKFLLILCMLFAVSAEARNLVLPPGDVDLVGDLRTIFSKEGESLLDIARDHGIGQDEIVLANPQVDRWLPSVGSQVVLPSRYILPDAPRSGLVLNLPEMRIYYYTGESKDEPGVLRLITHPVSVGRMDWNTPLGTTKVVAKKKDPTWTPPESIRREHEEAGDPLPEVVPAGPDNPLGQYAMRLGIPGYLIHSTNKPYGVGMRVTHGCVRMYPEDMEVFFDQVPVNTEVTLVNQPIKVGWYGGQLYIEIHPPMDEDKVSDEQLLEQALTLVRAKVGENPQIAVRWSLLRQAVAEKSGIPQIISRDESVQALSLTRQ